jgi:membrane dipeptidase
MSTTADNRQIAATILRQHLTVDLHSHLGLWEAKGLNRGSFANEIASYPGDDKLKQNILDNLSVGLKCSFLGLPVDLPLIQLGAPGNKSRDFLADEAWQEYQRQMALLREMIQTLPVAVARHASDIAPIVESGRQALFLSVEGGYMVENDLGRLAELKQDGHTKFAPAHYLPSAFCDNQTDSPRWGGLSGLGREMVREVGRLGMLLDVAHASFASTVAMAELAGTPMVLSHTMMRSSDTDEHLRFISRDHARVIADTGGVIGTWVVAPPYAYGTLAEYSESVLRLADWVGTEHVGWATDQIDAGLPDWFRRSTALPDVGAALLAGGFSPADLAGFFGGNLLRLHRAVVGEKVVN